jgi:hypothetical protein
MPIVDLVVEAGSITTRIPARGASRRWPDEVTTVDDTIVEVGGIASAVERAGWPDRARTRAAFDAAALEPEIVAAVAWFRVMRALEDAYPAWRVLFRTRGVSITWPDWEGVPSADRRLVVERLAKWAPTIVINGSTIARPWIPVPWLELVFGSPRRADIE